MKAELRPDNARSRYKSGYAIDVAVVGFGVKGKTLFGKSPEEEAKSIPEESHDSEGK
jgi:hypothetical protein